MVDTHNFVKRRWSGGGGGNIENKNDDTNHKKKKLSRTRHLKTLLDNLFRSCRRPLKNSRPVLVFFCFSTERKSLFVLFFFFAVER